MPSSHANFETRDRKGTCETHLESAQPNINETFKQMFRRKVKVINEEIQVTLICNFIEV